MDTWILGLEGHSLVLEDTRDHGKRLVTSESHLYNGVENASHWEVPNPVVITGGMTGGQLTPGSFSL